MLQRWLHVLTSDQVVARADFVERAEEVIIALGSAGTFHLRTRTLSDRDYVALALRLLDVSRTASSAIVINERVDVALASGADGVQLGRGAISADDVRRIGPKLRIGVSVHSAGEAGAARVADWVMLGHVFSTPSHPKLPALGLVALQAASEATPLPVIAVGGVTPSLVRQVLEVGASGVAVLSNIWGEDSPKSAIFRYLSNDEHASQI